MDGPCNLVVKSRESRDFRNGSHVNLDVESHKTLQVGSHITFKLGSHITSIVGSHVNLKCRESQDIKR